jgi:putative nucleotidyltransferase with HDIG domain
MDDREPGPTITTPAGWRWLGGRLRFHAARWGLLLVVAVTAYLVFPSPAARGAPSLSVGQVAEGDVIAPFSYIVSKPPEEYAREGEALARSVRPIYKYSPAAFDSAMFSLQTFFGALAEADGQPERAWAIAQGFRIALDDEEAAVVAEPQRRDELATAVAGILGDALDHGVADAGVIRGEPSPQVIVRRGEESRVVPRDSIRTLGELIARAERESARWPQPAGQRLVRQLVVDFFVPTLVPDHPATLARREQVRRSVDSVKYVVRAGERLVGAGELVSPEANAKLAALEHELTLRDGRALALRSLAGSVLYNLGILTPFWLLLYLYRRRNFDEFRHLCFFAGLFTIVILLSAGALAIFRERPELLPIPLAALLVGALFDGRMAVMAAVTLAVLVGGQWALRDSNALFFGLMGGVAGALGMRAMRRRHVLYVAIGLVMLAYLGCSVTVGLLLGWSTDEFAASALAGLVVAIASGAFAMLALPFVESATRITTHLTLLELSDYRRPLLRRLALEAPGTWAHSISMANLCEAACNAIGADGLMARVGCYYHDVGKLTDPQYFVENQRPGVNPHDQLSPDESARIIRRHVTEGLVLAREAKLPPAVANFIPEHHGTTEIRIFLHRARRLGLAIDLEDFRYPGPRPRSVETAVAMLADAAEAAVRVLDDPTPEAVREAIDQLVAQRVAGGQLDEAPLTLRDLERVKQEFARALSGIHHNRVPYPRPSDALPVPSEAIRRA